MQRLSVNKDTDILQRERKNGFFEFWKNQTRHNKPILG